ncbi:MAG: haloacid dehalogenase, partial [Merismopedia sp. SIO2A8]|nr:haloacid dehalogenase [Merismopedia sp. SIO2A8]
KTRREVEELCKVMKLQEPFITENGSGVFIPLGDRRFTLTEAEPWMGHNLLKLGCTYPEARAGLKAVSEILGEPLRGFGDLSVAEVQERTGLSRESAELAKMRDFTEPFVTPKHIDPAMIRDAVQQAGFKVTVGDRFSHLISPNAGKGRAAKTLMEAYQSHHAGETITTIGLGNSPNDQDLLEAVDHPIVVPGKNGPHPGLATQNWFIAPAPGAQGWAEAIQQMIAV